MRSQFAPQVLDMRIYRAVEYGPLTVRYLVQDLLSGKDPVRLTRQQGQYAVLHGGEVERDPVQSGRKGLAVYLEPAFGLGCAAPPQYGMDVGQHQGRTRRLRYVIVGTQAETVDLVLFPHFGREEDHRQTGQGGMVADMAADLVAVRPWNHDVEYGQAEAFGMDIQQAQGFVPVSGHRHAEAVVFQERGHGIGRLGLVFQQEDHGYLRGMQNTTIWITGASGGIGEALAAAYARRPGTRLILTARREAELNRVAERCGLPADRIHILPADVADHASAPEVCRRAWEAFDGIDLLILNAGISQRSLAVDTDLAVEKAMFDVNYFGAVETARHITARMTQRNSGHIAVISSVVGRVGTPIRTTYSATKHALHGYFNALRGELVHTGISVSLICPGFVKTQVSVNAVGPSGQKYGKMDPNQEKGMDADVFAIKALRALDARKPEAWIAGWEIVAIWLDKFCPPLLRFGLAKLAERQRDAVAKTTVNSQRPDSPQRSS